jgi:hypothetical protein
MIGTFKDIYSIQIKNKRWVLNRYMHIPTSVGGVDGGGGSRPHSINREGAEGGRRRRGGVRRGRGEIPEHGAGDH